MAFFYDNSAANYMAMQDFAKFLEGNRQLRDVRKQIFLLVDHLRGSEVFAMFFYSVIGDDPTHPPRIISGKQNGTFLSDLWIPAQMAYEACPTKKVEDENFGMEVIYALLTLIEECYPKVYEGSRRTLTQLANGATIDLVMKKKFVGKPLTPVNVPPMPQIPAQAQQTAPAAPQQPGSPAPANNAASQGMNFCPQCGTKIQPGSRFCPGCGQKLG